MAKSDDIVVRMMCSAVGVTFMEMTMNLRTLVHSQFLPSYNM